MNFIRRHIFWIIALTAAIIFIGADYIRSSLIRSDTGYTIGYVYDYKSNVRKYNNRIHYHYSVHGKKFDASFRSREINPKIEGQRIIVLFSRTIPSFSEPLIDGIIVDSVTAPNNGWDSYPAILIDSTQ